MEVFLKGLIAGFIIAVPSGPASVLCFRRVMTQSQLVGLFTVFGAATADAIYGLLAATGLTAVTHTLLTHTTPLRIFGGLLMLYLGVMMCRAKHKESGREDRAASGVVSAYFSAFVLMIAFPPIIISFLVVFTAIDLSAHHAGFLEASWLWAGVFLGSAGWWPIYKGASRLFGERLKEEGLRKIDIVAGVLICLFGVWNVGEAVFRR